MDQKGNLFGGTQSILVVKGGARARGREGGQRAESLTLHNYIAFPSSGWPKALFLPPPSPSAFWWPNTLVWGGADGRRTHKLGRGRGNMLSAAGNGFWQLAAPKKQLSPAAHRFMDLRRINFGDELKIKVGTTKKQRDNF